MNRIQISDQDLRDIVKSIDYRVKNLWDRIHNPKFTDSTGQDAQEALDRLSELSYRLRTARKQNL